MNSIKSAVCSVALSINEWSQILSEIKNDRVKDKIKKKVTDLVEREFDLLKEQTLFEIFNVVDEEDTKDIQLPNEEYLLQEESSEV